MRKSCDSKGQKCEKGAVLEPWKIRGCEKRCGFRAKTVRNLLSDIWKPCILHPCSLLFSFFSSVFKEVRVVVGRLQGLQVCILYLSDLIRSSWSKSVRASDCVWWSEACADFCWSFWFFMAWPLHICDSLYKYLLKVKRLEDVILTFFTAVVARCIPEGWGYVVLLSLLWLPVKKTAAADS